MLLITAALITLLVCVAAKATTSSSAADRDWKGLAQYRGQLAHRYRLQRDWLQHRLTVRVLEVRRLQRQRAHALHRPDVVEAIRLAAITWNVSYDKLVRRARCESVLSPTAKNRYSSASGLFQFLDSTWASTPYGRESVWSPYANALAAGWMSSHGRDGEWVCR